jgi:hypothetical protein
LLCTEQSRTNSKVSVGSFLALCELPRIEAFHFLAN